MECSRFFHMCYILHQLTWRWLKRISSDLLTIGKLRRFTRRSHLLAIDCSVHDSAAIGLSLMRRLKRFKKNSDVLQERTCMAPGWMKIFVPERRRERTLKGRGSESAVFRGAVRAGSGQNDVH